MLGNLSSELFTCSTCSSSEHGQKTHRTPTETESNMFDSAQCEEVVSSVSNIELFSNMFGCRFVREQCSNGPLQYYTSVYYYYYYILYFTRFTKGLLS